MYRIFIVEDDKTIANVVKKHLEGWGYEVRIAEDLKNITAEYAAFSPQLTLMDIGLPFHNGLYWCRKFAGHQMRRSFSCRPLRII